MKIKILSKASGTRVVNLNRRKAIREKCLNQDKRQKARSSLQNAEAGKAAFGRPFDILHHRVGGD